MPTSERPPTITSSGRVVEGTPGFAIRSLFRESARGAALPGSRACSTLLAFPFDRDPLPQDRHLSPVPGGGGHGKVTWGARVCQAGVNPPVRAVALVGVTQRVLPRTPDLRKPGRLLHSWRSHLIRRGLLRKNWSSDGAWACSGDITLQKLTGGGWPTIPGEKPAQSEV